MRIRGERRYIYDDSADMSGGLVPGFDEFLSAELGGLSRYAAVLTGNRQDAHDLLAEVLVAVQLRWHRIGVMAAPLAYVRRMVTHRYISDQRRWSRRMIRPVPPADIPETSTPGHTDDVDGRSTLRPLLAALPRRQRAVVVLRFYLGLDTAEIADELGITQGGVRMALSRGLASLRIALDDASLGAMTASSGPVVGLAGHGQRPWDPSHVVRSEMTEDER